MRIVVIAIAAVLWLHGRSAGQQFTLLDDDFDRWDTISAVYDHPAVKEFRAELKAFEEKLLRLKEKHILALLGQPLAKQGKTFAMPAASPRFIGLPGIRSADEKENKDHWEFHRITDQVGLHIYYHTDGVSPCTVLYHFRVDATFPRLTKENLKTRLAWDRKHFEALKREFERRRAAVFVWEVDPEADGKIDSGESSRNRKERTLAWIDQGKKLGHKLEEVHLEGVQYRWFRPDGTLAREAYSHGTETVPHTFIEYDKTGKWKLRDAWSSGDIITNHRWMRVGSTHNIRYETCSSDGRPHQWSWYDRKGKLVRFEWDDNGDGVPDRVTTKEDDKDGEPLQIKESWAVHPNLIPAESRIPDQPERRVPLRKIKAPPVER